MCKIRPQIQAFTKNSWSIPDLPEIRDISRDYDSVIQQKLPGYDYLVYLRHHGFPSPLLDWTRSPYVAAYFAFEPQSNERVAVFVYQETSGHGKHGALGEPNIQGYGPYVAAHSRHFLQQSQYTVATVFSDDEYWFTSHEEVFDFNQDGQDNLWKVTLPSKERLNVLKKLDAHNLNAFSLFENDESLLRTIMIRELEFENFA